MTTLRVDIAATGQNINRLRIKAGLTVKDMQMIFGFTSPQAIYKWIHGYNLPTLDNLIVLSQILDTPMSEIVVVEGEAV